MENIFDSICSALGEPENKGLFLKSEGIDLLVLMMKYVELWIDAQLLVLTPGSSPKGKNAISITRYQDSGPCYVRSSRHRKL